ncbi:MAG: MFS transporter [Chromatiales bacterium]|nr:MFS transporter [Chromatiales bacterium]
MNEQNLRPLLLILFVGVLMGALDLAIIGPALPAIQADLGLDTRALAWIFNIYVLFQLMGTPLMAKFSDRYGRRSIYVLNLALFGLGSLILAVAPSFEVLLVGRAVQGLGAGGIFPVASAVIGDTFPPEKRGPTLGLLGAVFGIAFLVGPILGGVLLRFSWHWLFIINLPVVVVLIWQALRLLPATRAAEPKPFDATGALLLSMALGSLAIVFTEMDASRLVASLTSLPVAPFAVLAIVLTPLFWRVEKRAADPIIPPRLLASLQMRLTGAIAIGTGTLEAGSAFFPALAVAALGVTDYNASLLMLPSVLATTIGAPLAGRLLNRMGSRLIVQLGLAGVAIGTLMYALLDLTLALFIIGGVIGGFGFSALLGAPLRYIVLHEAQPADRGTAQGLLTVFLAIGQLSGAAVIGGVAASRGGGTEGYQLALLVLGILTALLVVAGFALKSRAIEQAEAAATATA